MKNIIILILICISLGYSQIITDTKTFNRVYVKAPAKSAQITCKIRVDLSEGLIDNYACDVNDIAVYNKNKFWIGSLGEIKAFHNKRYTDYDLDRYEGKGKKIWVDYVIPTENASWDNAEYVSCPNNHIKTIEDDYFTCIKKAICKSNEKYDSDNNECKSPDTGYMWMNKDKNDFTQRKICKKNDKYNEDEDECVSLDSGYVWMNKDKNDFIQKPECKGINERYNVTLNECENKVDNSHWIGNTLEYECNEGFVNNGGLCEEKVNCKDYQRYDIQFNRCITKPENSSWKYETDVIWDCNEGYVYRMGECELKRKCTERQKYVESDNTCVYPPEHGAWNYKGELVCDEGYVKDGYICVIKANCEHWNEIDNTCYIKPDNSHWLFTEGPQWECNKGYIEINSLCELKSKCEHWNFDNNTCYTKPENSHWSYDEGPTWDCDAGYHRGYESCYTCENGSQYSYAENKCIYKPQNSEWVSEGNWKCNEGFFQNSYNECEKIKKCGFFERYDISSNVCVEKPFHAHWVNESSSWNCDDGYYRTYLDKCEKTNPIDLTNYIKFDHDVTFGIGVANAKDIRNESTPIWNIDTYYNAGIKIGNEFFSVRGQFGVGLIYTEFEYSGETYTYMDENLNSLAFTFGPNIGFDFWLFTIDYAYIWSSRNNIESIDFSTNFSKYKIGFNITEHVNINVTMITNLIESTKRLKEFDENLFMVGLTYRF